LYSIQVNLILAQVNLIPQAQALVTQVGGNLQKSGDFNPISLLFDQIILSP